MGINSKFRRAVTFGLEEKGMGEVAEETLIISVMFNKLSNRSTDYWLCYLDFCIYLRYFMIKINIKNNKLRFLRMRVKKTLYTKIMFNW